jgi:hypothetical protein
MANDEICTDTTGINLCSANANGVDDGGWTTILKRTKTEQPGRLLGCMLHLSLQLFFILPEQLSRNMF